MALVLGEVAAEDIIAATAVDVAAYGAEAAAAAEVAAAAGGGTGAAIPPAVVSGAKAFAASFVLARLFAPSVSIGQANLAQTFLANTLSNMDPIPVIYGSRRIGGSVIEVGLTSTEIQADRLHRIAIWGEGPISAVQALYLDTVSSGDARFATGAVGPIEHYTGTDGQAASATLIAYLADSSKWNANCTLSGIAYTYLSLVWNPTIYPHGRPALTADVDGRTLYDPRSSTTAFSRNPALAIRDYLTNTRYGRGVPTSMIDDAAFQSAANTCDESVTVPDGLGGTTTQARYTCDGVLSVDQTPLDNVKALLTSCRGFLVFSGGQYKLRIDKAETPVAFVLNADNIIGGWSIQLGSKRNRFNRVRARFFNKDASWQPDYAVYEDLAHRALDANQVLSQDLDLPFTRNVYTAAQIAQIEEKRSRYGTLVSLTATIAATCLEVGDVVPLAHATPGWPAAGDPADGKLFRVVEMELLSSDEVRLTLLEYSASVYTLTTPAQVTAPASTSLPDLSTVGAPGTPSVVETLYQTSTSAGLKSRATVTWAVPNDVFVQRGGWYQLERSPAGAGTWTIYPQQIVAPGQGVATVTFIDDDVAPAVYDWRVAAFNTIGAKSAYSPTTTKEIAGLNAPPSNVANFAVQNYAGQAKFTWDKASSATDLAVLIAGRVYVRWSPKVVGAVWEYGSLVNPDGYPGDTSIGFGPLMTGTYMAKFWNGRAWSLAAQTFVVTEALLTGLSTLASVTESPAFTGAKSNVAAVDSGIELDGTTLIDSMLTNIDTWSAIDSLGGVLGSGSYTFAAKLDLGSKRVARLFSSIDSLGFSTDEFIDSHTDLIDSWGLIDGPAIEDAEVQLWVRHTDDDPNGGSPTWSAYERLGHVADFNFRGFDFRLDFATGSPNHNRIVTGLSVTAKN